jgi:transcriptional regulator with XRE-family HTH domain
MDLSPTNTLAEFLRERRGRLDPTAFGFAARRRRTPGLRREEVAQRAGVSATWYTWLEQGRGGPPSADTLERLARALELDGASRELLFLLAQQRPPPLRARPDGEVSPALQRMIESLRTSPAVIKTALWDLVAWNEAARVILGDYRDVPPQERNVLRRLFCDPSVKAGMPDWESDVRLALSAFRLDAARAAWSDKAAALIAELEAASPDFRRMWNEGDARTGGQGVKHMMHPRLGALEFDYATFSIDGADGLTLVVYTPASAAIERKVERLMAGGIAA